MNAADFWAMVDIRGPEDCWPWKGLVLSSNNPMLRYGYYSEGSKRVYAHRKAYELWYNEQLGDMQALHTCDNPPCCNGKHLFKGTHADNMRDMIAKKRGIGSPSAIENL